MKPEFSAAYPLKPQPLAAHLMPPEVSVGLLVILRGALHKWSPPSPQVFKVPFIRPLDLQLATSRLAIGGLLRIVRALCWRFLSARSPAPCAEKIRSSVPSYFLNYGSMLLQAPSRIFRQASGSTFPPGATCRVPAAPPLKNEAWRSSGQPLRAKSKSVIFDPWQVFEEQENKTQPKAKR